MREYCSEKRVDYLDEVLRLHLDEVANKRKGADLLHSSKITSNFVPERKK